MPKRAEVYSAIDTERAYQDRQWPDPELHGAPNPLTIGEHILLAEEYLRLTRAEWIREPKPEIRSLHFVRKVAGIMTRCMEQHGAPKRGDAPFPEK